MQPPAGSCRLCNSTNLALIRKSNYESALQSTDFSITDSRYGLSLSIFLCRDCGFHQCLELPDTTDFYRALKDNSYEDGRSDRIFQCRRILSKVIKHLHQNPANLRLLDIGAGSGILLEAAAELGFDAEGVEPSEWLRKAAQLHGCKINADIIPHASVAGQYDVITLIDVIEHVTTPLEMLRNSESLLKPDGLLIIVTPDVKSIAARIMGWKWWHYRIAHVGYFSLKNIEFALSKVGLSIASISRPSWSFSAAYIRERLRRYFPDWLLLSERPWMHRFRVRLNLLDSLMIIAKRT